MAQRPDLKKMVGGKNRQIAEDNNRNFARFMESIFNEYNPKVLVETVMWVFRSYIAENINTIVHHYLVR